VKHFASSATQQEIAVVADNVKQHIVPRFYIAFFHAAGDTKVFVRVKGIPGVSWKSPKGQGYEEDAFTVTNGNERDTSCDEANKVIENWCAPHLDKLTAGSAPTDDQWRAIFFLTANLLCRSRWTRDNNLGQLERVQKLLPKFIDVLKEMPPLREVVHHMGLSPDDWDEVPSLLERAAKLQYPSTAALGTEAVAEELKFSKDCNLLIAPAGTSFITSDEPPLILEGGRPLMTKVAPGFLARSEIEVFMPLKPEIACLWSAKSSRAVRPVTVEEVVAYNRQIWENCYERAFASRRNDLGLL
jgi:Protein of unknown function (DUF4238)